MSVLKYINNIRTLCVIKTEDEIEVYDELLDGIVESIVFATSAEEGFAKYLNNEIDIIIVEYELTQLNGLDLCAKVRKKDKQTPIILISTVEDIEVVREALSLGISGCIKKPILPHRLLEVLINATKMVLADKHLLELETKDAYTSSQESLAFEKQLNILRNDYYYQVLDSQNIALVDFLYDPLDVLSGDAYSARKIDEHKSFFLIVDGMGKGVSASLTAMLLTAYVNHIIDVMLQDGSFDLQKVLEQSMRYIQPILLDEEAIAVEFIVLDSLQERMDYAIFAMPVMLLQDTDNNILRIKSNNPPLSKYQQQFNVDSYDTTNTVKFLFYSDGVVESETKLANDVYANHIEEDFLNSFTREDLKNKIYSKIATKDDDITLIFINKLNYKNAQTSIKIFDTKMEVLEDASSWYKSIWKDLINSSSQSYNAEIVFTELFMNAYEHGNLGLKPDEKHRLLEADTYFEELQKREKDCDKKISVIVNNMKHSSYNFIITQITDEGIGFDTQILSNIFRNSETFNGRGVFMSRKNSFGIYYNAKGNSVIFLSKIENKD